MTVPHVRNHEWLIRSMFGLMAICASLLDCRADARASRAAHHQPAHAIKASKSSGAWCLQDYCPCDTSDPDFGGADISICRAMRAGVAVDTEMLVAGAASRDARKALREFDRQYGR